MHTEPELCHCTKCGRPGVKRDNGNIPSNWKMELQDQLLCPTCWDTPRMVRA